MGVTCWGGGAAREIFILVFFFNRNDRISSKLGRNHP